MITKDVKSLLGRMNGHLSVALEAGAGFCVTRSHHEVFPDHVLLKLLDEGTGDIPLILRHFNIDVNDVVETLNRKLSRFASGCAGKPRFSRDIIELIEAAWVVTTIHLDQSRIRSGALVEPFLGNAAFAGTPFGELVESIEPKTLYKEFFDIVADSSENVIETDQGLQRGAIVEPGKKGESALEQFTNDLTARAREGDIDPVFGRDQEIRQVIDILSRRRKNNPILVGEAGVGKTAVVEGLALRIAADDVVDSLKSVELRELDLGLLQAGASVKGEFENRLKKVITQVTDSPKKIILFIDEAHTLIGAGGAAGSGDAANLLKPALARGKLRTVGATTFSEYKKYIEKDPALERRFQMVKVDEPSEETCSVMLRGIKGVYEEHHGVTITDAAITSAVSLSKRYIAGRQLPDKAVDLLDTASARVKMTAAGKPKSLDLSERRRDYTIAKLESLQKDAEQGWKDPKAIEAAQTELEELEEHIKLLEKRWKEQTVLAEKIQELKQKLSEHSEEDGQSESLIDELTQLRAELTTLQEDDPLVLTDVDTGVIATVIADWTGIPVGRMVKDQAAALLSFEEIVGKNIIGQDEALKEVAESVRVTKSGMGKQDNPIGVFLFVGPSGTGKTETAINTAEVLFGGSKFMTTINMSEYQEKHTVSQLKGSPPGYVGYGEGGVLTEAVRRRPYSVVLLDEVEKADREVMNLFYQVFDKGFMRDGEGREIDFKNTIIMMTSNIASDTIMRACGNGDRPTLEQLNELIRPELTAFFQPALLARIKIIPFYSLGKEAIKKITVLKLDGLAKRLKKAHDISVEYTDQIVDSIAEQCTQSDTGARNVDYIIQRSLLPNISRSLVEKLSEDMLPEKLVISNCDAAGNVEYEFG